MDLWLIASQYQVHLRMFRRPNAKIGSSVRQNFSACGKPPCPKRINHLSLDPQLAEQLLCGGKLAEQRRNRYRTDMLFILNDRFGGQKVPQCGGGMIEFVNAESNRQNRRRNSGSGPSKGRRLDRNAVFLADLNPLPF
jgi:hypothetical protein